MKILRFSVKRFKSLKEITLPDGGNSEPLGNLVILIGRNSSGKSNLLEALDYFFREFDPSLERAIGAPNFELWYGRETSAPIEWQVDLLLNDRDFSSVVGQARLELFQNIPDKNVVQVVRRITATPQDMRWQTNVVKLGDVAVVLDGQAAPAIELTKALGAIQMLPADAAQSILTNLSALLKSQFKYIGATRDAVQTSPSFGNRSPIVNPSGVQALINQGQAIDPATRTRWRTLSRRFEDLLPNRESIASKSGQLFFETSEESVPFAAAGGGAQSVVALANEIEPGPQIMALEEPENHLHPELVKKMLRYLDNLTKKENGKQMFVSTHSPFFVDVSSPRGIIGLYWDGKETKARQMESKDMLRAALFDIGARPSDVFFADFVFIVEGESDKVAMLNWARILGTPLEDVHAAVIPARGMNKIAYHLKLWAQISRDLGLRRYVLVDKSGEAELEKVVLEGLVEREDSLLLERGDIEDYFPSELLLSSLSKLYPKVDLSSKTLPSSGRAKAIEKLLDMLPQEWKVPVAEEVSRNCERKQIPREVADFLRRIHNENSG